MPKSIFVPKRIPAFVPNDATPFWSVMVPTYNRREFLGETLESILSQDPGHSKMQICVVDNATSTFDVKLFLDALAPNRIDYLRHEKNIGGIRNINSCIENSRGSYVHIIHDDDIVLPNFYSRMEEAIVVHPMATIFMAAVLGIDEEGREIGRNAPPGAECGRIDKFLSLQAVANRTPTQTVVIPRRVYETVGGYAEGLVFTPDWEMAFRAADAGYAVAASVNEPLAAARWHAGSDSARIIRGTRHIKEMKMTINELIGRLTPADRREISGGRYAFPAMAAMHYASTLNKPGDAVPRILNIISAMTLEPTTEKLRLLGREVGSFLHLR